MNGWKWSEEREAWYVEGGSMGVYVEKTYIRQEPRWRFCIVLFGTIIFRTDFVYSDWSGLKRDMAHRLVAMQKSSEITKRELLSSGAPPNWEGTQQ
jgi:hypothetical protein